MNSKMTMNSQLSTTKSKKQKQKQIKQTTRTGTESQKWRSHGGLSVGRGRRRRGEDGGKGTGNKKHKWQAENRQGEVKNSIGHGEAQELICITHGHELRGVGENAGVRGCRAEGIKDRKKWDNCNSTVNKINLKKG